MLPTIALLIIAGNTIVSAQYITVTVAGTGIAGYSGDGQPGKQANINGPTDVCLDAANNVYFVDANNGRIRKVLATNGVITTLAGGGTSVADGVPATTASLTGLSKMCADAAGNVYFSVGNKVRKVNTAGIITTVAGTGTPGYVSDGVPATSTPLNNPMGVGVDAAGNIYISDVNNYRIREVAAGTGIITTIAGTGSIGSSGDGVPATTATLGNENSLSMDGSGNIFCANSNAIRKINLATGIISNVCNTSEINGMFCDGIGNIYYVQDSCGCQRYNIATGLTTLIANNGIDGYTGDGGNSVIMELNHPQGVCADASGSLYVADQANNRIRKLGILANAPTYIFGTNQLITPCPVYGSSLASPLSVTDLDTLVTETWTVVTPPTIGTLAGFPATAPSGGRSGLAMPTATSYTPDAGYLTGSDSFVVQVSNGTSSAITKIYVSINVASAGTISGAAAVCAGSYSLFTETVGPGAWSTTNPHASIDFTGALTAASAGIDTISYTLSYCSITATHVVSINPNPVVASIMGSDSVCVGGSVTVTDATTGGVWSGTPWGDFTIGSASGTVSGASYSYGAETIYYAVTSAAGCTTTVSGPMTVVASTVPISSTGAVCIGASIPLYETIDGGTWSVSNGHATITGSGTTVSFTGVSTGIDTVTYINTNTCGTSTVTQAVTINALVAPGTVTGPSSVCVDGEISLTPSIPKAAPGPMRTVMFMLSDQDG